MNGACVRVYRVRACDVQCSQVIFLPSENVSWQRLLKYWIIFCRLNVLSIELANGARDAMPSTPKHNSVNVHSRCVGRIHGSWIRHRSIDSRIITAINIHCSCDFLRNPSALDKCVPPPLPPDAHIHMYFVLKSNYVLANIEFMHGHHVKISHTHACMFTFLCGRYRKYNDVTGSYNIILAFRFAFLHNSRLQTATVNTKEKETN